MMIAFWHIQAKFGYKSAVIDLLKEWMVEIGPQTGMDITGWRILTGHIGSSESEIISEMTIANMGELDAMFAKLASIKMHADWGRKMSENVVSGSNRWEIFRVA